VYALAGQNIGDGVLISHAAPPKQVRRRYRVPFAAIPSKVRRSKTHLEKKRMALPENIKTFNKNAAKTMDILWAAHPKPVGIAFTDLTGEDRSVLDNLMPEEMNTKEREEARACLDWLLEEEYVKGRVWQLGILDAGFPRSSWEALKTPSVLRPKLSIIETFADAMKGVGRISVNEAIGELMAIIAKSLEKL
jgi:hypothetical protein